MPSFFILFYFIFNPGEYFLGGKHFALRALFASFCDETSYYLDEMTDYWDSGHVPVLSLMLYDPRRTSADDPDVSAE